MPIVEIIERICIVSLTVFEGFVCTCFPDFLVGNVEKVMGNQQLNGKAMLRDGQPNVFQNLCGKRYSNAVCNIIENNVLSPGNLYAGQFRWGLLTMTIEKH